MIEDSAKATLPYSQTILMDKTKEEEGGLNPRP